MQHCVSERHTEHNASQKDRDAAGSNANESRGKLEGTVAKRRRPDAIASNRVAKREQKTVRRCRRTDRQAAN